jgi:signal transduction histidine kinase
MPARAPDTSRAVGTEFVEEEGMKTLVATIVALALLVTARPAPAYVVAVTTSIPVRSLAADADLKAALRSAIEDVLRNAIAFLPTFVTVETARVVGDRLYILLVIADDEGEATLRALSVDAGPGTD